MKLRRICSVATLLSLLLPAENVRSNPPDLTGTIPIIDEQFDDGLRRYNGTTGVWTTMPKRGKLVTNSSSTVFWDKGVAGGTLDAVIPSTVSVSSGSLALRTVKVPKQARFFIDNYLRSTNQSHMAGEIKYASGMISTLDTLALQYGYVEIVAKIPRGKGRWPAFWLTFAGVGWPPEIDVFEVYGKGILAPTSKDDTFNTAVHFDAKNEDGDTVFDTDIVNPFEIVDGQAQEPHFRNNSGTYAFRKVHNAAMDLDADIYSDFHAYAALWTPEHISFYFGKDRSSLDLIYRTTTPQDAMSPMYLIANDHFTARGGWWEPDPGALDQTLAEENAFLIRSVTVRALKPAETVSLLEGEEPFDERSTVISDTSGADFIAPGPGFDIIELSDGSDTLYLQRGREAKVIVGFGQDDRIVLDSFPFDGALDALSRLTQVGHDVWLSTGADPLHPQSLIFRNTQVENFSIEQIATVWPVTNDHWHQTALHHPKTDADEDGVVIAGALGGKLSDNWRPAILIGGPARDAFMIGNENSTIIENEGSGIDVVIAKADFAIPQNIEHIVAAKHEVKVDGSDNGERLEAMASGVTLEGHRGDDLYVIQDDAQARIITKSGDGHDVVRGFKPTDSLQFDQHLSENTADWRLVVTAQGATLVLSETQSMKFDGVDAGVLRDSLGLE